MGQDAGANSAPLMKTLPLLLFAATGLAEADLYVTNFTALNGTSGASGEWRNQTTATNLGIPVTLTQDGGEVQPEDGSSTESVTDDSFPWQDVPAFPPFTPGIDVFEPTFNGDYINIETEQGTTTEVVIDFGATITDPVISFTDVEYRTTITFPVAVTRLAGTSNLEINGASLRSDKSTAAGDPGIFEQEAAGSVRLPGTFDRITFFVAVGIGDGTVGNEDRTGYVVSTMVEPQVGPAAMPVLEVAFSSTEIQLHWPIGEFDEIQMSAADGSLGSWMPVPELDPGAVGSWSSALDLLGPRRFFRGVYNTP